MKKRKVILVVCMILLILVSTGIYFFYENNYKTINLGNNITKTTEGITEYILNLSSYEAEISVEVESNKNSNKYRIKQEYASPNIFKQEVLEPSNIQGLKTTYDGTNLKIENTKINLSQMFENYQYLSENALCLSDFIENYKKSDNSKAREENGQIVLETKIENSKNKYAMYETLRIDKSSAKPVKLEIQDINKKMLVYILYNEIKINSTSKEEILAFRIREETQNI